MASGGFNFGGIGGTSSVGVTFGAAKTTAPTLTLPTYTPATTGVGTAFDLTPKTTGVAGTTNSSGFTSSFSIPAKTTASNFSFGTGLAPTTTTSSGLTLGSSQTGLSTGLGFGTGTTGIAVSTTGSGGFTGFNFNAAPATTSMGFGTGLLGATATTAGNIFSNISTTSSSLGLGGADPKTSTVGSGLAGSSVPGNDGKALKESLIPEMLVSTVDDLQKYVKDEKAVREDIVRMSSKPMLRVQEDIAALRQLLSVVSNGLQRNTCILEKLKAEMIQELKNAEMVQRTKDIPPGLQYENTAPTEYFEQLVDEFEVRMAAYRQQIEMLENHLAALHQPVRHSPTEIFTLIKKLHETFVALAAQLYQVHEAIKGQKEQFLTYRRVFHGDSKDIFQRTTLSNIRPTHRRHIDISGPTPFPGVTNAAAAAVANIVTRSQQPAGPPVAGLLGSGVTSSWLGGGSSNLSTSGLLSMNPGISLLGQPVTQASTQSLGTSSMFSLGTTSNNNNNTLNNTLFNLNNTANASLNVSAATKQPFTLQKPPQGAKRGKR